MSLRALLCVPWSRLRLLRQGLDCASVARATFASRRYLSSEKSTSSAKEVPPELRSDLAEDEVPFSESKAYKTTLDDLLGQSEETMRIYQRDKNIKVTIAVIMFVVVFIFQFFIPGYEKDPKTGEEIYIPTGLERLRASYKRMKEVYRR